MSRFKKMIKALSAMLSSLDRFFFSLKMRVKNEINPTFFKQHFGEVVYLPAFEGASNPKQKLTTGQVVFIHNEACLSTFRFVLSDKTSVVFSFDRRHRLVSIRVATWLVAGTDWFTGCQWNSLGRTEAELTSDDILTMWGILHLIEGSQNDVDWQGHFEKAQIPDWVMEWYFSPLERLFKAMMNDSELRKDISWRTVPEKWLYRKFNWIMLGGKV